MRSVTAWADSTPVDRDQLAAILKCDDATLDKAQIAIARARAYVAEGTTSTDLKHLRRQADVIRSSLKKMRLALISMEGADHFLDDEYAIENDGDVTLMALRQRTGASSGFSAMVDGMASAVDAFKSESLEGATQGRNADGSHTMAIRELALFAQNHLADMDITHTNRSLFPQFVELALPSVTALSATTIKRALSTID